MKKEIVHNIAEFIIDIMNTLDNLIDSGDIINYNTAPVVPISDAVNSMEPTLSEDASTTSGALFYVTYNNEDYKFILYSKRISDILFGILPYKDDISPYTDISFKFIFDYKEVVDSSKCLLTSKEINDVAVIFVKIYKKLIEKSVMENKKRKFSLDDFNIKIFHLCDSFDNLDDNLDKMIETFNISDNVEYWDQGQKTLFCTTLLEEFLKIVTSQEMSVRLLYTNIEKNETAHTFEVLFRNREEKLKKVNVRVVYQENGPFSKKYKPHYIELKTQEVNRNGEVPIETTIYISPLIASFDVGEWDSFCEKISSYIDNYDRKNSVRKTLNSILVGLKKEGAPNRDDSEQKKAQSCGMR